MTLNGGIMNKIQTNDITNEKEMDFDKTFARTMAKVYLLMFSALLVTSIAALSMIFVPQILYFVFGSVGSLLGIFAAQIAIVIIVSIFMKKIPTILALLLFYVYAILNGFTISVIFFLFELYTIFLAFTITALMFIITSIIAFISKKDLANAGGYLMMGLIGLIIAMGLNLLFASDALSYTINIVAVIIFIGLTAYDTLYIKSELQDAFYEGSSANSKAVRNISIFGALKLYLDFINLFLHLLELLAKAKSD